MTTKEKGVDRLINEEALLKAIDKKGVKKGYIAEKCGISPQSLRKKIKNESEFKISEVDTICEVLGICSLTEKEKIFFNK